MQRQGANCQDACSTAMLLSPKAKLVDLLHHDVWLRVVSKGRQNKVLVVSTLTAQHMMEEKWAVAAGGSALLCGTAAESPMVGYTVEGR